MGLLRRHKRLGCQQNKCNPALLDDPDVEKARRRVKELISKGAKNEQGCKKVKNMEDVEGICNLRMKGCTRPDCNLAHDIPDHLILPIYCEPFLHGQCEQGSKKRLNCFKLHHITYNNLNKMFFEKLEKLFSDCDLCRMAAKLLQPGKLGLQVEVRNDIDDHLKADDRGATKKVTQDLNRVNVESSEIEETKEIRLIADLNDEDTEPSKLIVKERKVFDDDLIVQERLALDNSEEINLNNREEEEENEELADGIQPKVSFYMREVSPDRRDKSSQMKPLGRTLHLQETSQEVSVKEARVPSPIRFQVREVSEERTNKGRTKEPRKSPSPIIFQRDNVITSPIIFRPEVTRRPVHQRLGPVTTWSNTTKSGESSTSDLCQWRDSNSPVTAKKQQTDFAVHLRSLLFLLPDFTLRMSDFNQIMQMNNWKPSDFKFSKWGPGLLSTGLVAISGTGNHSKEMTLLPNAQKVALESFKENAIKILSSNGPLTFENFWDLYCDQFITMQFDHLDCKTTLWAKVHQIPGIRLEGKHKSLQNILSLQSSTERSAPQEDVSPPLNSGGGGDLQDQPPHQEGEEQAAELCYFFHQKGRCRYGKNCRFAH